MAKRWYRVHPAIGVARVGNAQRVGNDFYFIGPEIPDRFPNVEGGTYQEFKINGRIKPQAARFRIFEYLQDDDGTTQIREINLATAPTAKITWTVHLANRKANFCRFAGQQGSLDKKDGKWFFYRSYSAEKVRNPRVKGLQRRHEHLDLDPGEAKIEAGDPKKVVQLAVNHPGLAKIKTLGELRTDTDGRLIVIGGLGFADHVPNAPDLSTYANNDGWFDDVSDGPIGATVQIDGTTHEVDGAWLLVGPPDFAPAVRSYRTIYDTLIDVIVREPSIEIDKDPLFNTVLSDIRAMKKQWRPSVGLGNFRPSFRDHIEPTLRSMHRIMRIHMHGAGQKVDYHAKLDPQFYDDLKANGSANRRAEIFARIRDPKTLFEDQQQLDEGQKAKLDSTKMPLTYGEFYDKSAYRRGGKDDPAFFHSLSELQYELFRLWNAGQFDDQWQGPALIDPNAITPAGLDRAALDNAIGGAFFPGIEASWLLTKPETFRAPFRVDYDPNQRKVVGQIPVPDDADANLTRPLQIEAGVFSQQMALPWHADFHDCAGGKEDFTQGNHTISVRIAWWPAQRPDEVFSIKSPDIRIDWARDAAGKPFNPDGAQGGFKQMADDWWTLGFIVEIKLPGDAAAELYEVDGPRPLVA
jgi:L-Lysine epsilon oxidase N-terminal/L-lysine epsilon oxidase C-terminal domain